MVYYMLYIYICVQVKNSTPSYSTHLMPSTPVLAGRRHIQRLRLIAGLVYKPQHRSYRTPNPSRYVGPLLCSNLLGLLEQLINLEVLVALAKLLHELPPGCLLGGVTVELLQAH